MKTVRLDERLPPVRGLVPLHNARGRPFPVRTLSRWLRLNVQVYKTQKVDLLAHGPLPPYFEFLVRFSQTNFDVRVTESFDVSVSLRTAARTPPPDLARLAELGLFDLFLAVERVDTPHLDAWLDAAQRAELPARLQVQPPFPADFDPEVFARNAVSRGVRAANVMLADPFLPSPGPLRGGEAERNIEVMNALAEALEHEGAEANLYGLPLCHVTPANRGRAGNSPLFFRDHQQYRRVSHELARKLYRRSLAAAGTVVTLQLGRHTRYPDAMESRLARWLMDRAGVSKDVLAFVRTAWRGLGLPFRSQLQPIQEGEGHAASLQDTPVEPSHRALPAPCDSCALRRICDAQTPAFKRAAPGLAVCAQEGELVLSPLTPVTGQLKYFDAVDGARLELESGASELAAEANELAMNRNPGAVREREGVLRSWAYHEMMPKSLRWTPLRLGEVHSVPFPRAAAPLTVAATFGGGIADYVGFSVGRSIRIMCFMDAFTHRLVLHVTADGRYVLLRDGVPIQPVEFEGVFHAPARLPTVLEIGLSMWNVDKAMSAQNVRIWHGAPEPKASETPPKISIVIVSTRFTRRLQAVLCAIAHQEGIAREDIEVVVGYVPGIDATDDLITSMELAYPGLRIVRSAFPPERAKAKGLIINESVERASGEWVMILDSDIILSSDMLAAITALGPERRFAGPVGRKMLPQSLTARILLGEIAPWSQWDELLQGPGEDRYKEGQVIVDDGSTVLPIGFCQCVRRKCFETIHYQEYEHFEGADWEFSVAAEEHCGPVTWIDRYVLHLDHGGSQWFGAPGHL